jgi:hypothetical protein
MVLASLDGAILNFLLGPGWIAYAILTLVYSKSRRRRNTAALGLPIVILFYLFTMRW